MISPQAVLTSSSRFAVSRFIHRHPLLVDRLPEVGIADLLVGDHIDAAAQEGFHGPREPHEALRHAALVAAEIDDDIDIAALGIEPAAGRRPEDLQLANAELAAERGDSGLV